MMRGTRRENVHPWERARRGVPFSFIGNRGRVGVLGLGLVLLVAACAPAIEQTGLDPQTAIPTEAHLLDEAGSSDTLRDTFLFGYSNISERYIELKTAGLLAEDGLKGLATIDPALTVQHTESTITLLHEGIPVSQLIQPAETDPEAWTDLTVAMIESGRRVSPDMAAAPDERILEAVFDAALSNLDIFSRYAGAEEARQNRTKRDGFGGIGIHFRMKDSELLVLKVIEDSPAARAGILPGDVITHIDDTPTLGMASREVKRLLQGPVQSKLDLVIRRTPAPDAPVQVTLERAHVIPDTVTSRVEDGILHLTIQRFNRNTAPSLLARLEAAQRPDQSPLRGVVLDMRGNPGGLLKQSIDVVDMFLSAGQIISTFGRHPDSIRIYQASGKDLAQGLPLVVIVDGKSASAAEVVAAALQDSGRAVVIGTTSYGKGTVQTVIRLPNDGEITLTWSRLIAPSGYAFHGLGVPPVICTNHGVKEGRALVTSVLEDADGIARLIKTWRSLLPDDQTRRQALRAACPAESRLSAETPGVKGEQDIEDGAARAMLEDERLYARALLLSTLPSPSPSESAEVQP